MTVLHLLAKSSPIFRYWNKLSVSLGFPWLRGRHCRVDGSRSKVELPLSHPAKRLQQTGLSFILKFRQATIFINSPLQFCHFLGLIFVHFPDLNNNQPFLVINQSIVWNVSTLCKQLHNLTNHILSLIKITVQVSDIDSPMTRLYLLRLSFVRSFNLYY